MNWGRIGLCIGLLFAASFLLGNTFTSTLPQLFGSISAEGYLKADYLRLANMLSMAGAAFAIFGWLGYVQAERPLLHALVVTLGYLSIPMLLLLGMAGFLWLMFGGLLTFRDLFEPILPEVAALLVGSLLIGLLGTWAGLSLRKTRGAA